MLVNVRLVVQTRTWAQSVQEIANDFSVLVNKKIKKEKQYGDSQEITLLAEKIDDINKKTHKTWEEMKRDLKL